MVPESYFLLVVIFISLLFISAFFSSAEVAFLSLSEVDLKELRKKATKRSKRTVQLWDNHHTFFIAIRFASLVAQISLVCTVILFSKIVAVFLDVSHALALVLMLSFFAIAVFTVNEIWAKFVLKKNRSVAEFLSLPAMVYFFLVKPFVRLLARLFEFFSNKLDVSRKSTVFEHHKIMALVEDREENGGLEDNERAMIDSIFEFGETEVHEIMIPRIDIVGVEENISLEDLAKLIKNKGHSRIPLYTEGLDNILGIIHAKDLLAIIIDGKVGKPDLKKLARPVSFVPESKKLHHLLKEFQKGQQHMAIVVDEYGGTAGLVTLEDVLEEIVGEIQDEYDKEPPLYKKIDENSFLIDAKIDLDELNEHLEMDLPTEGEFESLGGFIFSLTDYIPEQNEVVEYNNYTFIIEKIDRNRIIQVKLTRSEIVEEGKKDSEGV